ncbi:hypothetical protein SAMN05444920_11576 [Nonomuraea solani]|uniref:Secreted protein n=1 Tax=Nonomuraea solani TaxID=1144553 RepID=A0A1H6EQF7_9ACTN|nr:hypothetical protein SAMN05444920_11576 [Nonomuraea solani]
MGAALASGDVAAPDGKVVQEAEPGAAVVAVSGIVAGPGAVSVPGTTDAGAWEMVVAAIDTGDPELVADRVLALDDEERRAVAAALPDHLLVAERRAALRRQERVTRTERKAEATWREYVRQAARAGRTVYDHERWRWDAPWNPPRHPEPGESWIEPMRVAGAGTISDAAAVVAWLNLRDLQTSQTSQDRPTGSTTPDRPAGPTVLSGPDRAAGATRPTGLTSSQDRPTGSATPDRPTSLTGPDQPIGSTGSDRRIGSDCSLGQGQPPGSIGEDRRTGLISQDRPINPDRPIGQDPTAGSTGQGGAMTALERVLADRPIGWHVDFAVRLALSLAPAPRKRRGPDGTAALALAMLRRSGAVPPEHDPLVVAWASVPPTVAELRTDPLLDHLLPRLFEAEGAGAVLRDERSASPTSRAWLAALDELTHEGRISRDLLLDGCLGRFLRGGPAADLRFFVRLHELLDPSHDEVYQRRHTYLRLLPTVPGPVAESVLRYVRRLEALGPGEVTEALRALLFRGERKLLTAGLTWLDEAARDPAIDLDALAPALGSAFACESADVQGRAVRMAVKHAKRFTAPGAQALRDAIGALPQEFGETLAAVFGGEAERDPDAFTPTPLPAPREPGPFPAPILAAENLGTVPNGTGWVAAELWLAGVVRLHAHDPEGLAVRLARERTSGEALERPWPHIGQWSDEIARLIVTRTPLPEEKLIGEGTHVATAGGATAAKAIAGGATGVNTGGVVRRSLGAVAEAGGAVGRAGRKARGRGVLGTGRRPRRGGPRLPLAGEVPVVHLFLLRRWAEVYEAIEAGTLPPYLLSEPTEGTGHLNAGELVERVAGYERLGVEALPVDLQQALLRLPREVAPEVAARANRLTSAAGRAVARWMNGGRPDPVSEIGWAYLLGPAQAAPGRAGVSGADVAGLGHVAVADPGRAGLSGAGAAGRGRVALSGSNEADPRRAGLPGSGQADLGRVAFSGSNEADPRRAGLPGSGQADLGRGGSSGPGEADPGREGLSVPVPGSVPEQEPVPKQEPEQAGPGRVGVSGSFEADLGRFGPSGMGEAGSGRGGLAKSGADGSRRAYTSGGAEVGWVGEYLDDREVSGAHVYDLVPRMRATPTGLPLVDELLSGPTAHRLEDHDACMSWWPYVMPSHREAVALHLVPHLLLRWRRPQVEPAQAQALALAGGPPGEGVALVQAYFVADRAWSRWPEERARPVVGMVARGDLDAEQLGRQLALLVRRTALKTGPVFETLESAAKLGAHREVWRIMMGFLAAYLPGPGEQVLSRHTQCLGFALRAAQWAGARGPVPCVAEIARRRASNNFVREARRLHTYLT